MLAMYAAVASAGASAPVHSTVTWGISASVQSTARSSGAAAGSS